MASLLQQPGSNPPHFRDNRVFFHTLQSPISSSRVQMTGNRQPAFPATSCIFPISRAFARCAQFHVIRYLKPLGLLGQMN